MESENMVVTLYTLGAGAAHELFQEELTKVIENILDVNTDGDAMREVTLKVKIKPDKGERGVADVLISCTSKLAGLNSVGSRFYLGKHEGKPIAYEHNPKQLTFDEFSKPTPVLTIKTGEGA